MISRAQDTPVGCVTARAANPTTRRSTPLQDRSPLELWPVATAARAALSQGQHPAHHRHAISTREHQTGGAPTRPAPTRRGHPARPPPDRSLPAQPDRPQGQAPPGWPTASLDPRRADRARPTRAGRRPPKGMLTHNQRTAALTLDRSVPHQLLGVSPVSVRPHRLDVCRVPLQTAGLIAVIDGCPGDNGLPQ
jgi:hypothetical protein